MRAGGYACGMTRDAKRAWTWMPVIIGVAIGAVVAGVTDQWWWVTIGALVRAAVAAWQIRRPRGARPGASHPNVP